MKKIVLVLFCFIFLTSNAQDLYNDALTAASYAYSHIKKAYEMNNMTHTHEYADKAIKSFMIVEELSGKCGCSEANETAYLAKVDLESLLSQDTYEQSRFYAKRVKELGFTVLSQLTDCQSKKNFYYQDNMASIDNQMVEVSEKQRELEERKRQLEIEQKNLDAQIAHQNKLKEEFEAKRDVELKEQALIKSKAELALDKLEKALQELGVMFDDNSMIESQGNYVRSEADLMNETLIETKNYYIKTAKELTATAMKQIAGFVDDSE